MMSGRKPDLEVGNTPITYARKKQSQLGQPCTASELDGSYHAANMLPGSTRVIAAQPTRAMQAVITHHANTKVKAEHRPCIGGDDVAMHRLLRMVDPGSIRQSSLSKQHLSLRDSDREDPRIPH